MRHVAKQGLIVIGVGLSYYIWLSLTDIGILCVFHLVTGFMCPGCGVTTMCVNLLHLDFLAAFQANKFLFCSGPLLLGGILYQWYLQASHKKEPKWYKVCCVFYAVVFVAFGIMRNIL